MQKNSRTIDARINGHQFNLLRAISARKDTYIRDLLGDAITAYLEREVTDEDVELTIALDLVEKQIKAHK
jgi:hypothetical protein